MKFVTFLAACVTSGIFLAACGDGESDKFVVRKGTNTSPEISKPDSPNANMKGEVSKLLGKLSSLGRFKTLAAAVEKAGLNSTLESDGPFTLFAPTDEAFAALGQDKINALLAAPDKLKEILLFHVVAGAVDSTGAAKAGSAKSVQGGALNFAAKDSMLFVNNVKIIEADIKAANGVIHVIDSVLIPPQAAAPEDIVKIASADSRFSTLVTALKAADLVSTLQGSGPFTVFAPTNDAFAKIDPQTLNALLADKAKLSNILLYHVVAGAAVSSEQASQLTEAKMANGAKVAIKKVGETLKVNDATVVITDIKASNGVIHVIDTVILPPSSAN